MPLLDLVVQNDDNFTGLPNEADLLAWAESAVRHGGKLTGGPHELTIRIVDTEESQHLNVTYRGKDRATNVLSFPFEAPAGVPVAILGDLAICAPVVEEEAREQDKPTVAHWAHLVVHGTLHLLGHDHINDDDAHRMETLERDILASFGFPDPYAETATP